MQVPLELSFRGVESDAAIETLIADQISRLEEIDDSIVSCHVAVERPQRHQATGGPFRVRVDVRVPPGHELVATREPGDGAVHDDLTAVLRDTFHVVRRQLRSLAEKRRGDVKRHLADDETALVVRLNRDDGFGFLRSLEGREVYFHRNSVRGGAFDRLEVGTAVRFAAETGVDGLQASAVTIVDKPGGEPS